MKILNMKNYIRSDIWKYSFSDAIWEVDIFITFGNILINTACRRKIVIINEKAKDYRIVLSTCHNSTHRVSYYVIYL